MYEIFSDTGWMQLLWALIVLGWVIGGYIWLRTLRRHHISYKVALKDVFLTIRK